MIDDVSFGVQLLEEGFGIARHAGSEHHDLEHWRQLLEKVITEWALLGKDLLDHLLIGDVGDVHLDDDVRVADRLVLGMD